MGAEATPLGLNHWPWAALGSWGGPAPVPPVRGTLVMARETAPQFAGAEASSPIIMAAPERVFMHPKGLQIDMVEFGWIVPDEGCGRLPPEQGRTTNTTLYTNWREFGK